MRSDLFGTPLRRDVLGLYQLRSATVAGKRHEILCHHWHRAPCAFLPWGIGGRVDDNLTDHAPARMVGVAPRDQETSQGVGNALGIRLGCVHVQMPEGIADVVAVVHRPGEFTGGPARSVLLFVDTSTVLTVNAPGRGYACNMPIPRFFKGRVAKEEAVLIADPRVEGWESVGMFEDRATAVAWRDQLRLMGVDACCVADHPLDRTGRGDIFLVVPPDQWSHATEIVDNLG